MRRPVEVWNGDDVARLKPLAASRAKPITLKGVFTLEPDAETLAALQKEIEDRAARCAKRSHKLLFR